MAFPPQNLPQNNTPQSPMQAPQQPPQPQQPNAMQGSGQTQPPPPQMHPNGVPVIDHFNRAIPGQSLTDTPKNSVWEHPPKYTRVHDALNFVFDQLVQPQTLRQTFMLLEKGVSVEDLARMILFSGFSEGKWTPDLAMLMARPLVSIIAGIAHRAGLKHAKMTRNDRSGFKHMVNMSTIPNISSSVPTPPSPQEVKPVLKGLLAPKE